jgi:hypothetical protein
VDNANNYAYSMSLQAPSITKLESKAPIISPLKRNKLGGVLKALKAPPRSPRLQKARPCAIPYRGCLTSIIKGKHKDRVYYNAIIGTKYWLCTLGYSYVPIPNSCLAINIKFLEVYQRDYISINISYIAIFKH